MSSPRKFSEKIALIQQKQAEGDAAFNTIIYEVEAAKQRADQVSSGTTIFDVPTQKHDRPFQEKNEMKTSDNNNNNGSDRLLQPPDNSSWRRTHSDSSLHHAMMPTVAAHYHARFEHENTGQQSNYDINDMKMESPLYTTHHQYQPHYPVSNFQHSHHPYDFNNNNNYANGQTNANYSFVSATTTVIPQQPIVSSSAHNTHAVSGLRYSGESSTSNVLMLPPNHNPRGGGSLPDLRTGNVFHNSPGSFSNVSSPPTSTVTQRFFRSSSPQQNGDGDLFILGPQQQLPSSSGPVKPSPSIRRRHSPIGEVRQSSPRRQHSPSPDVSSTQHTAYRVEPSSPQSQPSYSPQNSPHLIPSPTTNELNPFSPQSSTDNQQCQPHSTLPNHFDRINLDANNVYSQQQQQQQPPSSSSQQDHSSSINGNYFDQNNFYLPFMSDISASYCHVQTGVPMNNHVNQKSPTIPNIILTGVDSSKLDLSDAFDGLIDPNDLPFDTDDFLLTECDLSVDPIICDDTFRLER